MGDYVFFVGQMCTLAYVVVYSAILAVRTRAGIVTPAMLAYPRRTLWAIGAIDSVGLVLGLIGASSLPGIVLPMIGQTILVWQVLLTPPLLGRELHPLQLLGVAFVVSGVITAAWPNPDALAASAVSNIDLRAAAIFAASMLPPAVSSILKERYFLESEKAIGQKIDVSVVNTFGSIAQAVAVVLLLPWITHMRGISLARLPEYLASGAACLVGQAPAHLRGRAALAAAAKCAPAAVATATYVACNLCFNLSILGLLRNSGALIASLCMACVLPLTMIAFSFDVPLLGPTGAVGPTFVAGAGTLLAGVVTYNIPKWRSLLSPLRAPNRRLGKGGCGSGREVVLQAFNWESCNTGGTWYNTVREKIPEIAALGVTAVWLPPPTESVSPQGYLPRDLYVLDSAYGTEKELRALLRDLRRRGIAPIADVVINHRCAHRQDEHGVWNTYGGRIPWGPEQICSNNQRWRGSGAPKAQPDYEAAPNIDHSQERVRKDLREWLLHMRAVGFDGWRFDFAKGFAGEYTEEYCRATLPVMAFGEHWDDMAYTGSDPHYDQDAHRQKSEDWCASTGYWSSAFDFTTKGVLQEAINRSQYWRLRDVHGRPPGLLGLAPRSAITFIDNHDTGSTLQHWPFPWQEVLQGYAYTLTHPGTPCVFWDHLYESPVEYRKAIQDLLRIRKSNDIHASSEVRILEADHHVYAACADGRVVVKIGHGSWSPNAAEVKGGPWSVACSGHNFAVWERAR
ncbi:unnamed protein product [Pedinophyceae sp. YPF-701]|nr:unnamed protein product [Pedinophyceae sp. YPF-701]